jgi:hypothetical protein
MKNKFNEAAPTMTVKPDGSREWRNKDGALHRDDGPALERADGVTEWRRNGELHRDDGPAREFADGTKEWWRNNRLHRDNGPAIEYARGGRFWYREGKLHRDDGPAIEHADGSKRWWIDGRELYAAEITALQQKQQQERQAIERERQSATAIQELLRHKALVRTVRLKK